MAEPRNIRPLLIGGGASVLVVAVAVIVFGGGSSKASAFATLDILEGKVTITPKAGAEPHTGLKAESLKAGATIETALNTLATVTYFDGSFTRIGPGAKYHLVELARPKGGKVIVGKLDVGETFHDVKKLTGSQSRFEVQTSQAVAAVRGTKFVSRCLPPLPCGYAVIEGAVFVKSVDGTTRTVHSGERVTISQSGLLSDLLLISKDDVWVNRNLVLDGNGGTTTTATSERTDATDPPSTSSSSAPGSTGSAGATTTTTTTATRSGATTTATSAAHGTTTSPSTATSTPSSTTTAKPLSTTTSAPPSTTTTTVPPSTTTTAAPGTTTSTSAPSTTATTKATTTTARATSTSSPNAGGNGGRRPAAPLGGLVTLIGGVAWISRHADEYEA